MKNMLTHLLEWAKDPFGRNKILRHSELIANMHQTRALTKAAKNIVVTHRTTYRNQRYRQSGHAFERAMLGNPSNQGE